MKEREAFQELDYKAVFGSMAKWVVEIDRAERIPEIVSRAFHVATQGRPGPVVIALPEDMLTDRVEVANDACALRARGDAPGGAGHGGAAAPPAGVERPIVLAGGSGWSEQGVEGPRALCREFRLPVAVTFRRQMLFPADHPNFAGDLGIGPNPEAAAAGQGGGPRPAGRRASLRNAIAELHAARHSGRWREARPCSSGCGGTEQVYRAGLGIPPRRHAFAAAAAELPKPNDVTWAGTPPWPMPSIWPGAIRRRSARRVTCRWSEVMAHLREVMPADTVYCNGAGNYATWVHRFWPFRAYGSQLAPTSGSMGYGVPAAVAAKALAAQRDGDRLRRRWLLHDERAGIRHRHPV